MLLQRIPTYKTYTNMPGYDLVATAPEHNSSARIQVKSRWRTNAPGFPLQSLDCDFVVFVRLNRGSKDGRAKVLDPDYFVFPISLLRDVPRSVSWNKLMLKHVPDWESYRNRWDLVQSFLRRPAATAPADDGIEP
ncbi:MAG TPA: hypothetical protein VF665_05510 [Longimicrobium sp.]|jgi:hypothetical protein|uniref:hypothetical protein n=1 Tax=Longimicrobium sp. TaxID=2029185 RepID=UPI002EDB7946